MIAQTISIPARVVAGLLARMCLPKLTPVAQVAENHEKAFARVFLGAVKQAKDAIPMAELERVLSMMPATGAPIYVLQDVVQLLADALMGGEPGAFRANVAGGGLPKVLGKTLVNGAGAQVICAPAQFVDSAESNASLGISRRLPTEAKVPDTQWGTAQQARADFAYGNKEPLVYKAYIELGRLELTSDVRPGSLKGMFKGDLPAIGVQVKSGRDPVRIIDGNHRVEVWRRQGYTHAPVWVVDWRNIRA